MRFTELHSIATENFFEKKYGFDLRICRENEDLIWKYVEKMAILQKQKYFLKKKTNFEICPFESSQNFIFPKNLSFRKYQLVSFNMAPSNICRIFPILIGIKVVYTSIRTGANVYTYIHAETQKHLQTRWNDDHEYDYCLNISFYVPVYFYWRD